MGLADEKKRFEKGDLWELEMGFWKWVIWGRETGREERFLGGKTGFLLGFAENRERIRRAQVPLVLAMAAI